MAQPQSPSTNMYLKGEDTIVGNLKTLQGGRSYYSSNGYVQHPTHGGGSSCGLWLDGVLLGGWAGDNRVNIHNGGGYVKIVID